MFDLFKNNTSPAPNDVKGIRDTILHFIKDQLRKAEGGEGANIKGLQLYISCAPEEKHLYEASVYFDEPGRFQQEEVQRIADDYAIELPGGWGFDVAFVNELPAEASKLPDLPVALFITTRKTLLKQTAVAYIKVRIGEAEKETYKITSESGKIFIGREKRVQTADGFFRENHIAFPANSGHESNKYVSRQHAHIEFDDESGQFLLFADEGGVPPGNKIKIRSSTDSNPVKLYTSSVGHRLQEGDQILLGQTALLEFSYSANDKEL